MLAGKVSKNGTRGVGGRREKARRGVVDRRRSSISTTESTGTADLGYSPVFGICRPSRDKGGSEAKSQVRRTGFLFSLELEFRLFGTHPPTLPYPHDEASSDPSHGVGIPLVVARAVLGKRCVGGSLVYLVQRYPLEEDRLVGG